LNFIVNTANLQKGGSIQTAVSFIKNAAELSQYRFTIILGVAIEKVISTKEYEDKSHLNFERINFHPTESISSYFKYIKKIKKIEADNKPNGFITVFGPSYYKPSTPHIMGFANGYYLYEDSIFIKEWKGKSSVKYKLIKTIHKILLNREAKNYWVETNDSRKRLSKYLNIDIKNIIVASNNASDYFSLKPFESLSLPPKTKFRLLYVSSYYEHKNHRIIPQVLKELKSKNYDVECIITLKDEDYKDDLVHENIINIGPIAPRYCPFLYTQSDVVFVPTLLETFSAAYPEALITEKPIVTSDLSFARDICEDAALYYKHDSPKDAAEKIIELIENKELYQTYIKKGFERLKVFDSPNQRFTKIINKIINV